MRRVGCSGRFGVPAHLDGAGCAAPAGFVRAESVTPHHDRDLEPFGGIPCATKGFCKVCRQMFDAMVPWD